MELVDRLGLLCTDRSAIDRVDHRAASSVVRGPCARKDGANLAPISVPRIYGYGDAPSYETTIISKASDEKSGFFEQQMARTHHTKAAEHHKAAAKSHRTAAEHHGTNDHHAAHEHSTKAHEYSTKAHGAVAGSARARRRSEEVVASEPGQNRPGSIHRTVQERRRCVGARATYRRSLRRAHSHGIAASSASSTVTIPTIRISASTTGRLSRL